MRAKQRYIRSLISVLMAVAMIINMISADVLALDDLFAGSPLKSGSQVFAGSGTEESPYLIQSASDWDTLSNHINGGGTDYSGAYFKLTDDISVSTMLGYRNASNVDIPFVGSFDGDGHTLNVSINYNGSMAAPFGCVCNAVIKNLKVTGTVNGGIHSSGLVGAGNQGAITGSTLEIYNVTTSVAVNGYNNSVASHQGGIVGHTLSARITMDNVVFSGSLNASSAQGGFIGWGGGAGDKISVCELSNCLFAGTVRSGNTFHPVGYAYNNNGKATLTNFYTTKDKNNNSNKFDYQGTNYILISGLTAKVTDGSAIRYYDNFASAIGSQNWTQGSTLTLLTDVTTSSTVTVPTGEHTLDLNGHTLKGSGVENVIKIESGSKLTVCDSATNGTITGGYSSSGYRYGAGIYVPGGHLILNSGTISGNRMPSGSTGGGGVEIEGETAKFDMYGGTISGNESAYGGGVYVRGGVFNLYDGLISGNKAHSTDGGGIHVFGGSSTLNMFGGTVTNNNATSGGGIGLSGGATVNISGGTISGNTSSQPGGGITNRRTNANGDMNATVGISGNPVIKDNTGAGIVSNIYLFNNVKLTVNDKLTEGTKIGVTISNGTGVFTSGWKDKMGDADPSKYFASDNNSYQVFLNDNGEAEIGIPPAASVTVGETVNKYATISDAINAWKNGGTLTLLKDATFNEIINMRPMYGYGASEYVLDLNGNTFHIKSIQVGLNNSPNTLRTGPHLTIQDSGTGGILHFSESGMIDYGGLVELRGGTLTGGNGTWGGLFLLHIYASLDMYDGVTLTGNTSTYGGAVLVGSDSVFNMYGGKITGNSASDSGGGVVIFDNDAAKFNLYGGEISGNRAPKGGGVSVNVGQFSICGSGAVIRDNVSDGSLNNETGTYTGGASSNVYLPSGKTIKVTAALSSTPVGVTLQNGEGVITSGLSDYGTEENFISDNADFEVRLENGEAILAYPILPGVSAEGFTGDYDGTAHKIAVTAPEGVTVKYGTQEGNYNLSENPEYTDAGTYVVYYQVSKNKFTSVTGSATVEISPINATVTIVGNNATVDYDGSGHTVTDFVATVDNELYDVTKDFTFDGDATAIRINAGTTAMELAADQFTNINNNFASVTFLVTDGYLTIDPIDATVTIVGNNATDDYDGSGHTVTGFVATADTDLYDVTQDFTFSGDAMAIGINVGTTEMGLKAEQFANVNENFKTVTFLVTDGYQTISSVDAVIVTAPRSAEPIYNGKKQELIFAGKVDGGTLYYALGTDSVNEPDDKSYSTGIPSAKETGSYYIWYKVKADSNHLDLSPACVKITLAEEDWITVSGTLYQSDGKTPLGSATVTVMEGNRKVDDVVTDEKGRYQFIVPTGVYSVVAEHGNSTETSMVTAFKDTEQTLVISDSKTESILKVNDHEDNRFNVAVGGLNKEARAIRKADHIADDQNLSVVMTVEPKTESTAANAKYISSAVENKSFEFFDAKIEKTIDTVTTVIDTTTNVLEIAVPYTKTHKRGVVVYSSDGKDVRLLKESDSKAADTFYIDKENGLIHIYANRFSTFAIGYTPYYRVDSAVTLGTFKGKATIALTNQDDESVFKLENVALDEISFADIPKGTYTMTVTWEDGAINTLTMPVTVS